MAKIFGKQREHMPREQVRRQIESVSPMFDARILKIRPD